MITKLLCVSALLITTGFSEVQAPAEDLLRQGLFEEEANRDFDKASERYRAVVAAHDKQRALAATATFRLGEIARKKNDKEAAAAAFRTVAERFPEQEDLARMSRENLAALGKASEASPKPLETDPFAEGPPEDPEAKEIERLKNIARNSPDLLDGDGATDYGWRALHLAAATGYTKVIAYLLENKADPNGLTIREQLTPLQIATVHGRLGAVQALLAAKADINAAVWMKPDTGTNLPLRDKRADKSFGEWTALDFAVLYDRREVVRTLIKAGADLKKSGSDPGGYGPFSPLGLAIYLHRHDIAIALIEAKAPVNTPDIKDVSTPLQLAIREAPSLVPTLLKAGADPNLPGGSELDTPLHVAVSANKPELAKLLIEAGADPKAVNSQGRTALHLAYTSEQVDLLVTSGADPDAVDKGGLTPLDLMAVTSSSIRAAAFETLLARGAVVADATALLQRASLEMLPVVRERVVYPKEQRPDAVLLSIEDLNMPRPTPKRTRYIEIRPAPGSPPPSIAEGMRLLSEPGNFPRSITSLKVVRRDAQGRFIAVFEWIPKQNEPIRGDLPALEWGDILELRLLHDSSLPRADAFDALLPECNITVNLGGISFARTITYPGDFWLGDIRTFDEQPQAQTGQSRAQAPRLDPLARAVPALQPLPGRPDTLPVIPEFVDPARISVTRRGVDKPLLLNLESKETRPFRLMEGDVLNLVLKESAQEDLRKNAKQLMLTTDFEKFAIINKEGLYSSLGLLQEGQEEFSNYDFENVRVARGGDAKKQEHLDFAKILPEDIFTRAAYRDELAKWNPVHAGDWILVPPLPKDADDDARITAKKILDRIRIAGETMKAQTQGGRPVMIPPAPGFR